MIFDSDFSDSGNPVSCFCDSREGSRTGVDGAPLKRSEKEIIQLASVRNRAICFRETSNYNKRQRKLANFLSLDGGDKNGSGGTERRNGDWIMCLNKTETGSVKTYPWTTTNVKQKFELVPWRKQKRQLDIINYTAWEPDELSTTDITGQKARKFKQHPPPTAHTQEIRRLIRLRFFLLFIELQRQKQMKLLSRNKMAAIEECVVPQRKFENVISERRLEEKDNNIDEMSGDQDSACDINDEEFYDDPKELANSYVGYFGSTGGRSEVSEEQGNGSGKQSMDKCSEEAESVAQVEHCMSEALSAFNYSDWLACCDSFKCNECKR